MSVTGLGDAQGRRYELRILSTSAQSVGSRFSFSSTFRQAWSTVV